MDNNALELSAGNTEGPPSPNVISDGEFDDDLGVPDSLNIIDIDGTFVEIGKDNEDGPQKISFKSIHNAPVKFKSLRRDVFIRGTPIEVAITDCERNYTTHLINPNLYTINFRHGSFSWNIKKRYKHFLELHQQLTIFRASLNIPFPTKTHRKRRESFRNNAVIEDGKKRKSVLPRFPKKPEMLVLYEQLESRKKQLQDYLTNLLSISIYRYHPATIEFLEISHLSFIHDLGVKGKESLIRKRNGSTQPGQSGCDCFGCFAGSFCLRCKHLCKDVLCATWRTRWFFLKETCFGYIDPTDGRVKCVVLYDHGFEVASGLYNTGLNKGFQIQTLSRHIVLKCSTRGQRKGWIEALKEFAAHQAYDFTRNNLHHSFAPVRRDVTAGWFVDGAGYMSAVAEALEGAQEEIFIADWWLSPEIYLKRPALEGEHWRLDRVLRRKAESGVRIFILLYKEFEMALGLNSYYSKQKLCGLHDNIKVLRHPDHAKIGVFFWAHHEKIVVVDQTYAFLGGVDLCYGRWDDHEHRLTDLGSITPALDISTLRKRTSTLPAGDSFRQLPKPPPLPELVLDSYSDKTSSTESLPKLQPGDNLLMPTRHTETLLNTPEMERKNPLMNIKKNVRLKSKELLNMVYGENEKQLEAVSKVVEKREVSIYEDLNGSAKYWIGKDYCNFIVQDFTNLDAPFIDFIDRNATPRMPWHDIACYVQGAAARDVARHFIQRWNATKLEKVRLNKSYPYLLPKSYNTVEYRLSFDEFPKSKVTCQVLRSASKWSCGFLDGECVEQSIHEGYVDAINRAEHFIYIENQFFISLPQSNGCNVKNLIAETLFKRIMRAHKENATFRVYIVMPLLPGFEGEVGGPTGTSLHAITHWNYASISRGKHALLNRLAREGIEDPTKYISFYGLRTHSTLNGEPISELIYVHSKLMIVDDKIVICGSANINDRSLIGKRDSEIAVFIEDQEFDSGIINGKPYPCGKYAGSLRKRIFQEHLGLIDKQNYTDVTDPVCDEFYLDVWHKTAAFNSEFYDKVFHCLPTDEVETFAQLKEHVKKEPLYTSEFTRSDQMLNSIEGHLVLFPLKFLCKEDLTPGPSTVEGMMPTTLWT